MSFWINSFSVGNGNHTSWKQHEFLHGQFVASVASTVDDIECWDRQENILVASQVSNVSVQGNTFVNSCSFADGQRHSQNGISTKFGCK